MFEDGDEKDAKPAHWDARVFLDAALPATDFFVELHAVPPVLSTARPAGNRSPVPVQKERWCGRTRIACAGVFLVISSRRAIEGGIFYCIDEARKGVVGLAEWFEEFFGGLFAKALPNWFNESQTREHVRVVKRLLRLRKGQRVLDIPCGMGRLTIPMARTGLVMTGVDLTASYLRRARRYARREGFDIRFVCRDMRDIAFDAGFDAAFNWWGSFGYFSDADNLHFCRQVFRALRPEGKFLVEGPNKSWILAHFRPRYEQVIGAVRIVERARWDARSGRVLSTWTFYKGGVTERRRVSMRIFNGAEMRSLLGSAGFRDIALFGHPPLGRFTRHSQRLIAVCKRPLKVRTGTS